MVGAEGVRHGSRTRKLVVGRPGKPDAEGLDRLCEAPRHEREHQA
jgi:hypothetical protein